VAIFIVQNDTILRKIKYFSRSRVSALGIATSYGLDDRGVGVRVPVGSRISLLHVVETGSGVHPTYYLIGAVGSFPLDKAAGA
jgi:hypothetical protein